MSRSLNDLDADCAPSGPQGFSGYRSLLLLCLQNWWVQRVLILLGLFVYFLAAFAVMKQTGIGCVFVHFLGIPCPGCGMTRALLSLLRLDFAAAFRFHPLIYAMPYVMFYILFPVRSPVHKVILSVIGVLTIIIWVIRIFCVSI